MGEGPDRFAALRAEARRRIEARRRTIAELARLSVEDAVDRRNANPDASDTAGEIIYDAAAFEARLFAEIAEWLEDADQFKIVTIGDLMQLGARSEHDESQT
jgi:hypothetical protein